MNDGSQGEQRGETPRRVGGNRGTGSLQTSQFLGEGIQTKDSPGPFASLSSSWKEVGCRASGESEGETEALFDTGLIAEAGGERLPSDYTAAKFSWGQTIMVWVDPILAATALVDAQRFGRCQVSCGLGLEEASRV